MSIRPIDIQIAIQKADQHAKEFNMNTRVAIQHQDITSEIQKQVVREQKQVVSTSSSRRKKIDRNEEKSKFKGKQGKKGKDKKKIKVIMLI